MRIGRARRSIGATLAEPDSAEVLEVEMGAPLTAMTRLVQDEARRPVEHLRALHRPDRSYFETQLQRTGDEGARRWSPMASAGGEPADRKGARRDAGPRRRQEKTSR